MSKMKDFLMYLEELAWDAIESGCQTDDEIFAYVSNWVDVRFETVEALTRQMYLGGPAGTEGLDFNQAIVYH